MREDAEAADQVTTAPATGGNGSHHARADFLQPAAGKCRGKPEKNNRHREDPRDALQVPVTRGWGHYPEQACQRQVVDTPRINRAYAQMDGNGGWRHQPAIEFGPCGNTLFR